MQRRRRFFPKIYARMSADIHWKARCGMGVVRVQCSGEPAAGPAGPVIRSQPTFSPVEEGSWWAGLVSAARMTDRRLPPFMMPAAVAHDVASRRGAVRALRGWLQARRSVIRHILRRPDGRQYGSLPSAAGHGRARRRAPLLES